ncbi:MAG TPA: hydroxymethylpyrimidine/phosphomethylpyrimidine kinase [Burkholderiales bacterium]
MLSFAATDPTGGAGLQADVLTLAALGCHPLSVATAITVQDTHGVTRVEPLEAQLVAEQAARLLAELAVAAFKIGVVASAANAQAIAAVLAAHPRVPVVLDPVLASGRGDALADAATRDALREALLPRATVLTPNTLEARALGGVAACLARGCRYVLVTGTHAETPEVVNTLHGAQGVVREDRWPRLPGSYHGSGCTLAAAIAARLAHGDPVPAAVRAAQDYTWRALERGFRPASGQYLPVR